MKSKFSNKLKVLCSLLLTLCVVISVAACGKRNDNGPSTSDNGEYYEITYFLPISTEGISQSQPDMQEIEDAINDIIFPKINARVNFVQLSWFQYNDLMTSRIASNEKFDLCYTSPTVNFYWTNIKRRAFLPLDDLIDQYAPNIKAAVPAYMWEQAKASDGKIYGVINQQIMPRTDSALIADLDTFDEFLSANYAGYTHENIYEYIEEQNIHAYDLLEEYVTWLKTLGNRAGSHGGKMGAVDVTYNLQTRYHWDDLGTSMFVPGVVDAEDGKDGGIKVFNQFTSDEFKADIQRAAKNYTSGLAPKTIKTGDKGTDMSVYDVASLVTWKPNDLRTNIWGKQGGAVRLGNPYYYISYILGSMTAISSTSENPARVMKFLDLLWTDPALLNLLCFGIEGEHYTVNKESPDGLQISMIKNSGYDNNTMTWAYSTEFVKGLHYTDEYDHNPYEDSKKINENAHRSDVIGFRFDENPVTLQVAECRAICTTYLSEFATGQHGNDVMVVYERFIKELETAGLNDILNEKQNQLNAWLGK